MLAQARPARLYCVGWACGGRERDVMTPEKKQPDWTAEELQEQVRDNLHRMKRLESVLDAEAAKSSGMQQSGFYGAARMVTETIMFLQRLDKPKGQNYETS